MRSCIKIRNPQKAPTRFPDSKDSSISRCGIQDKLCVIELDKFSFPPGNTFKMTSIIEHDMNIDGYLKSLTRNGKSLAFRRKRFYRLDGGILSKYHAEGTPSTAHFNMINSTVARKGKLGFELTLAVVPTSKRSTNEDGKLYFQAPDEHSREAWMLALQKASSRVLEGHYRIGRVIGRGSFGQVFIGVHRSSGTRIAIKTMEKEKENIGLFGQEIAILKRIEHPNIVKTYDVFETYSKIHIVMEYMEGGMLYDAISDGISFSEQDSANFMTELLDGILYLHNNGIVHRDLKPENVLCDNDELPLHVKLADFGLATMARTKKNGGDMVMSTMIGTPEFAAPEICRNEEYTEKVDIWALGMLCYNVIAGDVPLDHRQDYLTQLTKGVTLRFAEPIWQSYSEDAKSFIRAMLCFDPKKRLTALGCLVHPWLYKMERFPSKKFASNAHISDTLRKKMTQGEGRRVSGLILRKMCNDPGAKWRVLFIAVMAVNRFDKILRTLRIEQINRNLGNDWDSLEPAEFKDFEKVRKNAMADRASDRTVEEDRTARLLGKLPFNSKRVSGQRDNLGAEEPTSVGRTKYYSRVRSFTFSGPVDYRAPLESEAPKSLPAIANSPVISRGKRSLISPAAMNKIKGAFSHKGSSRKMSRYLGSSPKIHRQMQLTDILKDSNDND